MKGFWYSVFRPVDNRYYADKKLYMMGYFVKWFPAVVFLLVSGLAASKWVLVYLALGLVGLALVDFFVFDRIIEKLLWQFVFSHFYGKENKEESEYHKAMKNYEMNPTSENLEILMKMKE